jgi:uncharacterized protein
MRSFRRIRPANLPSADRSADVIPGYGDAIDCYVSDSYKGPMVLLRTKDIGTRPANFNSANDNSAGWTAVAPQVQIYWLPGTHDSIMTEQLDGIVRYLAQCFEDASLLPFQATLAYNRSVASSQGGAMFLDIHELELHKIEFQETLPPGRIDFGRGIEQAEPLVARGTAELLGSEIRLCGRLQTAVEVSCDRCLEPSRHEVDTEFDLFYRPMLTIAEGEDIEIRPAELDVGFYEGDGLLLEDALKEQVLLALPIKNICRPDCAGLCPECGQNLNQAKCGCRPPLRDLRWAPLEKFQK